jgi:hypothetical protein
MTAARWYTVRELADRLRLKPRTVWLYARPYRDRCRLGRNGSHPRLVLWIPADVARAIEKERETRVA